MIINTTLRTIDSNSYRSARVKSLFNAETGAETVVSAELPIEDKEWQIGVVVGPSGSGKTTIGRTIGKLYAPKWQKDQAIIDAIAPHANFDDVTAALSSVGLGTVPAWLRPYHALSNGEQFRANLARLICEAPQLAVIDEFSSVVDRQIAQIGAGAFAKSWRRQTNKPRAVLLSCHYDILDWIQPDWVYNTATGEFTWGWERQRPKFKLEIYQGKQADWRLFAPHHYLDLPPMIAATYYLGVVNGLPVAHIAFSTRPGLVEARACRLVIMPEWQGAGVGMRFLNTVCQMWLEGENRYKKPLRTVFHTSHPRLAAALRRGRKWTQISAVLYGDNKARSKNCINRAANQHNYTGGSGYGGHLRAMQGFRYLGAEC